MRIFLIVGGIALVLTIVIVAIKKTASGNYSVGAPNTGTSSALYTASPSDLQTGGMQRSLGFIGGKATFTAIPRKGTVPPPSTGPAVSGRTGRSAF